MVQLNVLGLLYCAHAALPHLLRAAGDGPRQVADMVNISFVAGRPARNGNGVYSLTKHGAGAFSESLRQVRTVFEELLAGNMNLGRPEHAEIIFAARAPARPRGPSPPGC